MKNMKFIRLRSTILGIILMTMISSSCEDENQPTPEYAGKWKTEKPYPVTTGYVNVSYYLDLSYSEFTETFVEPTRNSTITPTQVKIEGSVSSNGNILTLTPNKLSFSYYNSSTSTAQEPYASYTNKDQNFDLRLDGLVSPTSNYKIEYKLADGKLILRIDYNKDGVYSESETAYTKQ